MGCIYIAMEGLFRRGWVHISMLPVGGLCGLLVGALNQCRVIYRQRIITQAALGGLVILAVELLAGIVINIWLGWGVWDYSARPLNFMGQIWLPYFFLWMALAPLAIWIEDTLQWVFWSWGYINGRYIKEPVIAPYSLFSIYKDLVTLK